MKLLAAPLRPLLRSLLTVLLLGWAGAQTPPSYQVQPGDTLYGIARAFGVTVEELAAANGIGDRDLIRVGEQLVIPTALAWPETLPAPFTAVTLTPEAATQGTVQALRVTLEPGARLVGARYLGAEVPVAVDGDSGDAVAVLVTPVLQPAGRGVLELVAQPTAGLTETLLLPVTVLPGAYAREEIWLSAETSSLLEPSVVAAEHALMEETCGRFTAERYWQGAFRYPVTPAEFTSEFGTLRSYNGGPYRNFHRGLDFRGDASTPVVAAADGVVVLSRTLTVRGEAVIVDHGLGVCSGYMHLSRRLVAEGDVVHAGDLLGYVGSTGLVTGPHLHWEVRVLGVPVAPKQWVERGVTW